MQHFAKQGAVFLVLLLIPVLAFPGSVNTFDCLDNQAVTEQHKIVEEAKLATVQITSHRKHNKKSSGTGFLIGKQGFVITNYHVIRDAKELSLYHLKACKEYGAERIKVLNVDQVRDLALLRVSGIENSAGFSSYDMTDILPLSSTNYQYVISSYTRSTQKESSGTSRDDDEIIFSTFVVEGIIGSVGCISDIVPSRGELTESDGYCQAASVAAVADGSKPKNYLYNILRFKNEIAPGFSGAAITDSTDGRLIGVATGVVGKHKYTAFAIPAMYITELINSRDGSEITVAEVKDEVEKKDKYYTGLDTYSAGLDRGAVILQGNIIEVSGHTPVTKSIIRVYDKNDTGRSYVTSADSTGWFKVPLPGDDTADWRYEIDHPLFVLNDPSEADLGKVLSDTFIRVNMVIRDEYALEATWFYAVPPYVDLDKNKRRVTLYKEKTSKGSRPRRVKSRWYLCVEGLDCEMVSTDADDWLHLPADGDVCAQGCKFTVKYREDAEGHEDDIANLVFYDNDSGDLTVVPVYADMIEGDMVKVQGFVTHQTGGVPPNSIKINASIIDNSNDMIVGTPRIIYDEDGYFQFDALNSLLTSSTSIRITVDSELFRIDTDRYKSISSLAALNDPIEIVLLNK